MAERRPVADASDENDAKEASERATQGVVEGLDALENGETVSEERLRDLLDSES